MRVFGRKNAQGEGLRKGKRSQEGGSEPQNVGPPRPDLWFGKVADGIAVIGPVHLVRHFLHQGGQS
jgi:hypothetical protein